MEHVEETSERRGDGYVNLALLTDGLRAEREQGITIDVAYRWLRHRAAPLPARRRSRPRAVHAQHGHGRLDGRRRRRPRRRAQGRDRADATPHVDRVAARRPPRRLRGQQDGPRRLRRGALPRDRGRARRARRRLVGVTRRGRVPGRRAPGDNVVERVRARCRGGTAARSSRTSRRSRPHADRNVVAPPLPGAVGDPADVGRAPRLPRLRGPGRGRRLARRRRGRRAAVRPPHARRGGRDARRPDRRGGARACR